MFEYEHGNEDQQSLIVVDGVVDSRSLSTHVVNGEFNPPVDLMIEMWLNNVYNKSQSKRTIQCFTFFFAKFRARLQELGIDMNGNPKFIRAVAEEWAKIPWKEGVEEVSPQTFNSRLVAISSFYEFCVKRGYLPMNPIKSIDKRRIPSRQFAPPMQQDEVVRRLKAIDRSTLGGLRDYAMILLAIMTSRRRNEILNLKWGDFTVSGDKAIVIFQRCKGNKRMTDELEPGTWAAIRAYLQAVHGDLSNLTPDTWIWVSHANTNPGEHIGQDAIAYIWLKRLGTSKVHVTRHTFAIAMLEAGADIEEIAARLGHNSVSTTSVYLKRLRSHENPYAAKLEEAFGVDDSQVNQPPPLRQTKRNREWEEQIRRAVADNPGTTSKSIAGLLGLQPALVVRYRRILGI